MLGGANAFGGNSVVGCVTDWQQETRSLSSFVIPPPFHDVTATKAAASVNICVHHGNRMPPLGYNTVTPNTVGGGRECPKVGNSGKAE